MSQSVFAHIPGFVPFATFHLIITALWLLMCLQIIYALLHTIPVGKAQDLAKPDDDNDEGGQGATRARTGLTRAMTASFGPDGKYKCCQHKEVDYVVPENMKISRRKTFEFRTMLDPQQNHGSACQMLSAATRMEAITYQDNTYSDVKMIIARGKADGDNPPDDQHWRYLHLAKAKIAHGISQFLLVGVLEASLQLNVQVSLVGIQSVIKKKLVADNATFLSISLNVMLLCMKFLTAVDIRRVYNEVLEYEWTRTRRSTDLRWKKKEEDELSRIQRAYERFLIYVVIFALLIAYAVAKLIALTQCDHYMFNLAGCVKEASAITPH